MAGFPHGELVVIGQGEAPFEQDGSINGAAHLAIAATQQNGYRDVSPGPGRPERQDEDLIGLYLEDIGQYELLTKEGEVELAKLIESGVAARKRLLEPEIAVTRREKTKLQEAVEVGEQAEKDLYHANLRLVVSIAKRYQTPHGMRLLDLIQEGNFGLMHAVEKFDWRKNFKFSTYATWWITQAITRAKAAQNHVVNMPSGAGEERFRALKAKKNLALKLGRNPTVQEIVDATGLSLKKVRVLLRLGESMRSLDQPVRVDGDATFGDVVADNTTVPLEERAIGRSVSDIILKRLSLLEKPERTVLTLAFGLDGGVEMLVPAIAKEMKLPEAKVALIKKTATSKLSHPSQPDIRGFGGGDESENWRDEADCLGMDLTLFFPEGGVKVKPEIERICGSCAVRATCKEFAEQNKLRGFWAGKYYVSHKPREDQSGAVKPQASKGQ